MNIWTMLIIGGVVVVTFASRWLGPSDIYDNDQPKTVAYTVDMVQNGRWLLPVDMLGRPATKPPMYNWIGALPVLAGWHSEFALKLPSTIAAICTLVFTWHMARGVSSRLESQPGRISAQSGRMDTLPFLSVLPPIACIALLANYMFSKLAYTARPDMVLVAYMTMGWVLTSWLFITRSNLSDNDQSAINIRWSIIGAQVLLWLCVAGAALTKGLPSLILLLYVLLGAKLIVGRWSAIEMTGFSWGLPLALALFGAWIYGAYQTDSEHVVSVILGDEAISRIGRGGLIGLVSELWKMPAWFITRCAPWSVFALLGVAHIVFKQYRSQWASSPLGPCVLWVALVVLFFSCSGGKRADYLAPALPAVAILASYWLTTQGSSALSLKPIHTAAIGLAVSLLIAIYHIFGSAAAQEGYGRNVVLFTDTAKRYLGSEHVHFEKTEYTPLQALLGHNQPGSERVISPPPYWLIKPLDEPGATLVSDPIWIGGTQVEVTMALYRYGDDTEGRGNQ